MPLLLLLLVCTRLFLSILSCYLVSNTQRKVITPLIACLLIFFRSDTSLILRILLTFVNAPSSDYSLLHAPNLLLWLHFSSARTLATRA